MKRDVFSLWVGTEVAIAGADGAVAAGDCAIRQGRDADGISHFAAVAVCLVSVKP
jgi:hypothetical protein